MALMDIKYGVTDPKWDSQKATNSYNNTLSDLKAGKKSLQDEIHWVNRYYIQGDDTRMSQEEAFGTLRAVEDFLRIT